MRLTNIGKAVIDIIGKDEGGVVFQLKPGEWRDLEDTSNLLALVSGSETPADSMLLLSE